MRRGWSPDTASLDNDLPTSGKDCPLGYQYNAVGNVCDDLDECAERVAGCRRPEDCVNTIGSYRCDGVPQGACPPGYSWDDLSQRCAGEQNHT